MGRGLIDRPIIALGPFRFVSGSLSPFPFPSLPSSISLPSPLRANIIINLVPHVELSVLVLSVVPSVLSVLLVRSEKPGWGFEVSSGMLRAPTGSVAISAQVVKQRRSQPWPDRGRAEVCAVKWRRRTRRRRRRSTHQCVTARHLCGFLSDGLGSSLSHL